MSGDTIGHYRIEKKLGEGGVGEVYLALDVELDRRVALKRLRPELARREDVVARFRNEARTLAQLHHPQIATLYGLQRDGESLVMVMEFVEGETLAALLRRRGRLEPGEVVLVLVQALEGLGYAHDRGIVHRDIKGSNLILTPRGRLKLMDFGIARVLGEERVTRAGQLLGTPEYMSPEQVRGREIDARSDLYSLGALGYALLSGDPPYSGASDFDAMQARLEGPPEPLCQRAPDVSAELAAVLERALAVEAHERFADAGQMRAALLPLAEPGAAPPRVLGLPTSDGSSPESVTTLAKHGPGPRAHHGLPHIATLAGIPEPGPTRALRRPSRWALLAALSLAAATAAIGVNRLRTDRASIPRPGLAAAEVLQTGEFAPPGAGEPLWLDPWSASLRAFPHDSSGLRPDPSPEAQRTARRLRATQPTVPAPQRARHAGTQPPASSADEESVSLHRQARDDPQGNGWVIRRQ